MPIPTTPQFSIAKAQLQYEPIILVEFQSAGVLLASRDPEFSGKWLPGDGLVPGSGVGVPDSDYPAYLTNLRKISDGGVDTISFEIDPQGVASTSSTGVEILNEDLFSHLTASSELGNAAVRIRLGFVGGNYQDYMTIFSGVVDDFVANYESFSLDFIDDIVRNDFEIPPLTGADFFPRTQSPNVAIPIILGDVRDVGTTLHDSDAASFLANVTGSGDTAIFLLDPNVRMPRAGEILITSNSGNETLQYTQVDTVISFGRSLTRLTQLTRASAANHEALAPVTLTSVQYRHIIGFEGRELRNLRKADNTHPTTSPFTESLALSSTGGDARRIHMIQDDTLVSDGYIIDMAGPDRGLNAIVNSDANGDPAAQGWTVIAGAWNAFTPAGESEPVIRGQVAMSQVIPSELRQDVPSIVGERYRFTFTGRTDTADFVTVSVGTITDSQAYTAFGQIETTPEVQFEFVFISVATTTRITLLVDEATNPSQGFFDHIQLYDMASENPGNSVQDLIRRHMPTIFPDPVTFADAVARYRDSADRMNGILTDASESQYVLTRIADQFRAKTFLGEDGKQRWKMFDNMRNPVAAIDPSTVDKGSFRVSQASPERVFSRVFIYYDRDPSLGRENLGERSSYRGLLFSTPEGTNSLDDPALGEVAKAAKVVSRDEKTLEIFADMISDPTTADRLLSLKARLVSYRPIIAEFTSYLQVIDAERGDFVQINHPLLPAPQQGVRFEVVSKQILPNGMLTAWRCEEVRQTVFAQYIETWEPTELRLPSLIQQEDWEPPPPPQLAEPGSPGTNVCNPLIETWEPRTLIFSDSFNAVQSDTPSAPLTATDIALTRQMVYGLDFSGTPADTVQIEDTELAGTLMSNSSATVFYSVKPGEPQTFNNARVVGPGTNNAIQINNTGELVQSSGGNITLRKNKGEVSSDLLSGRLDNDFAFSIWAYLTETSTTQIVVEATSIKSNPFDSTPRHMYFIIWFDAVAARFKAGMGEELVDVFNAQTYVDNITNDVTNTTVVSIATWYHLLLDWDASTDTVRLTVDDTTANSSVITPEWVDNLEGSTFVAYVDQLEGNTRGVSLPTPRNRVMFGSSSASIPLLTVDPNAIAFMLNGRVALPYMWSRMLSAGEITSVYNGGNGLRLSEF